MSRIATNVSALNTWRNLSLTNSALSKSLERLSSGFRINRAADDAAGLAISEKMRGQIAGLNMAVKNAQDGISLIQTGEGALNEVHAMLKRMEELAVQAANDTNTPEDRAKLQAEMDQLAREVARIGSTTEFNTLKLLDGTFETKDIVFHIGANEDQNLKINIGDMRSYVLGLTGKSNAVDVYDETNYDAAASTLGTEITAGTYTISEDLAKPGTYNLVNSQGDVIATSSDGLTFATGGTDTLAFTNAVTGGTLTISDAGSGLAVTSASLSISGSSNNGLEAGAYTIEDLDGGTTFALKDQYGNVVGTSTDGQNFDDLDGNTLMSLTYAWASATPGNTISFEVAGIDISSSQQAANDALPIVRDALEKVSAQRSLFGATQNRLEHTINNLTVAAENLSAAESRIRDVDMALEMSNFTKHQILLQAGTAMLAQANAAPQSVLQLLG